jgi:hypothetical protein
MLETVSRKITPRTVQVALGVLWVIDGLLQLQHRMFTAAFASQVIAPAADGQPRFVSGVMHFWMHIFLRQPFVCNALVALTQLGIGVLLIRKSTVKYGLVGSVIWGLFVWYVGEGLGGLTTAQTTLLMGAPGAALLYAVIAFGVRPGESQQSREANRPATWLNYAWVALWLGGALLQLMNGQNSSADLSSMIRGMADGAPGWLAALDVHVANWLHNQGNWVIALLVVLQALIGLLALAPRRVRAAGIAAGIVLSLIFWVIGQSLGGYYTGLATDPNTAPLIILLGLAVLNAKEIKLEIT